MATERATANLSDPARVGLRSVPPSAPHGEGIPVGNIADSLARSLAGLGVRESFGLSGGAIAPFCEALERNAIGIRLFRHEAGSAFAAMESYFVDGRPVVVFATTGPGFINGLVGIAAARWEGAKMIVVSGTTPVNRRGQWAFQETSPLTLPWEGLYTSGQLFHLACEIHNDAELPELGRRLRAGFVRPTGFVAHLALPIDSQTKPSFGSLLSSMRPSSVPGSCSDRVIENCAEHLLRSPFVIWVGFGARHAAAEIRELAERTGAAVMCSPRAKGIFPETHPQFIGVTGFAGHSTVVAFMRQHRPEHILVLGTRLGEFTSFWDPDLTPSAAFVHVDLDPDVPGAAFPGVKTIPLVADISFVLERLLAHVAPRLSQSRVSPLHHPPVEEPLPVRAGRVRPQVLMQVVQRVVVEGSDAVVLTEAGNSFAWTTHHLRFSDPGRYRVSMGFGSMGHAVTGVVGAALARGGKAVAIAGDGAMLMFNEINTAVQNEAKAVWIVLNDSRYGMIEQGMEAQGLRPLNMTFPTCDFVAIARGMGADGIRVEGEPDLEAAVVQAMSAPGPFVVDVLVDPDQRAPFTERIRSLLQQGARPARPPQG
jgi:acetolactate synthase-1/2/3 large subunit